MPKLIRSITPDEVASYNKNGVVLLKQVIDLQAINQLRQCIDQTVKTLGSSKSGYNLTEITKAAEQDDLHTLEADSSGQHDVKKIMEFVKESKKPFLMDILKHEKKGNFLLDTGISARLKEFKKFVLRGACPAIAGELLNSEKVNFFGDQVFVKEPGTQERTAFHQDASYFEIDGEQCCVLWIPVDPVTLENGAMQYIRGSHRGGKVYKPNVFVSQTPLPGSEGDALPDIEGNMDAYDIIHFNVEPGDILVHNYKTIHGTGGNSSRYQVRRAASIRYCGDDIRFHTRPWAPKQLHHQERLADGEMLSGPDFPVVWTKETQPIAA